MDEFKPSNKRSADAVGCGEISRGKRVRIATQGQVLGEVGATGSTDSPAQAADWKKIQWINDLPKDVRGNLFNIVREQLYGASTGANQRLRSVTPLLDEEGTVLKSLAARDGDLRTGLWWFNLVECEVVVSTAKGKDHWRWQVKLEAGPDSVAAKLRRTVGKEAWKSLTSQNSTLFKIGAHILSYAASDRFDLKPIPLNVGSGGSISHLCDRNSCINQKHLVATEVHKDNLDRQRCLGVLILHINGSIVSERPCKHSGVGKLSDASAEELHNYLLNSCMRVNLQELDSERETIIAKLGARRV